MSFDDVLDVIFVIMENNRAIPLLSGALKSFSDKLVYFHIFNASFLLWIGLALAYFIYNTVSITCSQLQTYFIVWTCSYGLQLFAPIACILAATSTKNYTLAYCLLIASLVYKIVVVLSLLMGAWKSVGLCYISDSLKLIIIITNSLQGFCLLVDFVLVYRIKAVNRQILIERLMSSKIFAES